MKMVTSWSLALDPKAWGPPLLSELLEKSSQSLLSPTYPTIVHAYLAYDQGFLSLAHDFLWSLQTQHIFVVCSLAALTGGGRGVSLVLLPVGPLPKEQ